MHNSGNVVRRITQLFEKGLEKPLYKDFALMILFGVVSYSLGLLHIRIEGISGASTDLIEIPLLISVFHFSNPLFLIGTSAITSFATPAEGSYFTTLLMHGVGLTASWYVYKALKQRIAVKLTFLLIWAVYVFVYYYTFIFPLLIVGNYLSGLNTNVEIFPFYLELIQVTRFEQITTSIISSLYLLQHYVRHDLKAHKANLELLVKRRTNELELAVDELKLLNSTKDKFFSIIAHDLRSPFSSVLTLSDFLVANYDSYSNKDKLHYLELLNQSVNNTFKLIENLLQWAAINRDVLVFEPQSVNISTLVYQSLNGLRQTLDNKHLEVKNNLQSTMQAHVDPNMILTVLRNLISNAVKFTPEGGLIQINAISETDKLIISVKDSGIGMDEQRRNDLFNITKKVTRPGTNKEKGTGLGLLLCKEFVEKHGGKIWVTSEVGQGSEFNFSIPTKE